MINSYRWLALFGISLLAFTAFMDLTIVNTALPFIQKSFNAPILKLQWVSNAFSMIISMTMIAAGNFADRFGRKRIFFIGILVFTLAAWGAGASPTLNILIFFRALQGLGTSLLYTSSTSMLSDLFPPEEHAKAISFYTGITGIGLMAGPAIGGLLVGLLSWKWVFWVNVPMVIVGLSCSLFGLKTLKSHVISAGTLRIDWTGLILLVVGLGGFTYGIITGADEGWLTTKTLVPLLLGIVAIIAFVAFERRSPHPLLNLSMFKNKLILLAAISCAAAGVVARVFIFFDPLYLRVARELSPFAIGFLVAILPAGQVIVSCFFSTLIKKYQLANVLFISTASAFLAGWIHFGIGPLFPLAWLVVPFLLLGFTWGLSAASLVTAVKAAVPPEKSGNAIGTLGTLWNIIGVLFLAFSSIIFHVKEKGASENFMPAFHAAITMNALFLTLLLIFAIGIKRRLSVERDS